MQIMSRHLTEVTTNNSTQDGGRLHHQYEVPVNQWPPLERMPSANIEQQIGTSPPNNCEV